MECVLKEVHESKYRAIVLGNFKIQKNTSKCLCLIHSLIKLCLHVACMSWWHCLYVYPHCPAARTGSSQEWKSIPQLLLGPLSHSINGKWAFCCPFNAIIGAVQSRALWAEASALHWVSGHTLQSKCCVSPLSAITPPSLFTATVQPSSPGGKQEPENKQSHRENEIKREITEPEALLLPFL